MDILTRNTRDVIVVLIAISMMHVIAVLGEFSPKLSVRSCSANKIVLNVTNASASGIIYIQGQSVACMQTTKPGTHLHEFKFVSCGISWAKSFKVIIQKRAQYQTGEDKQIPVICLADLSDLSVNDGLNSVVKDDDVGQNGTVRPTASMKLLRYGRDVTGGNVKLTDTLKMAIELDAGFGQDLDIKAVSCRASHIDIITNSCAVDHDLFPNFDKPRTGVLTSTFGAFRTTELNGGSVAMTFTCILQVCIGSCVATSCPGNLEGWGRRRRSAYKSSFVKRQAENDFEKINVGATLQIASEQVIRKDKDDTDIVCIDKGTFTVGMVTGLGALFGLTSAICFHVVQKLIAARAKTSV